MTNMENSSIKDVEMKTAMRVSAVSIAANLVLSIFKLIAGLLGKSAAMVSDAVHSASDVFSTIVVIIGIRIAHKDSDEDHPYGHDRLESVAAVLLAAVLAVTGIGIGWSGIKNIVSENHGDIAIPTMLPVIAAVVSIIVKEAMYWYTRNAAIKITSDALMADAWHHRSDSLSSIGSLVGIIGARMGYPVLDSVASVVICLFILKAAFDILRDALNKMVDKSCDKQTVEQMKRAALLEDGVIVLDCLRTRLFGSKCYVDIEIGVDGNIKLSQAHQIAEKVHDKIEGDFPQVKHCMVHVNPVNVEEIQGKIQKAQM